MYQYSIFRHFKIYNNEFLKYLIRYFKIYYFDFFLTLKKSGFRVRENSALFLPV